MFLTLLTLSLCEFLVKTLLSHYHTDFPTAYMIRFSLFLGSDLGHRAWQSDPLPAATDMIAGFLVPTRDRLGHKKLYIDSYVFIYQVLQCTSEPENIRNKNTTLFIIKL